MWFKFRSCFYFCVLCVFGFGFNVDVYTWFIISFGCRFLLSLRLVCVGVRLNVRFGCVTVRVYTAILASVVSEPVRVFVCLCDEVWPLIRHKILLPCLPPLFSKFEAAPRYLPKPRRKKLKKSGRREKREAKISNSPYYVTYCLFSSFPYNSVSFHIKLSMRFRMKISEKSLKKKLMKGRNR